MVMNENENIKKFYSGCPLINARYEHHSEHLGG